MQTIFALSSAPGKAGVAVIRLSGAQAKVALQRLQAPLPSPRMATLAMLKDAQGMPIDQALALYFPAPHSFTGEDVVELHIHGSRAVTEQLLGIFSAMPELRLAEPGEFTRRAFLNGKMDLTAAEGLADLINAETAAQQKQALRLLKGEAATFYEKLRQGIVHVLALLEAYIDFPDEDIPEHILAEIHAEVQTLISIIEAQLQDSRVGEKIRDGVRVAILGAPNVGKSSLMNLLARRDVAIVSHIAGTTRDVIEVHLDMGGYSVILSDTAGIREQAGEIEAEGIRRSFARAQEADIRIVMFDAAFPDYSPSVRLIDADTIVVINKSDLGLPSPLPNLEQPPIAISVNTGHGLDNLMDALERRIAAATAVEAGFITRSRHRAHLTHAIAHLKRYAENPTVGLELRCEELRRAAAEIGKITGTIATDELLGHIFVSFCIGK